MGRRKKHRSDILDQIIKELTPEKLAEMRERRKSAVESLSLEYQLGVYIGEYIVSNFLPTLSIDMITTRKVIKVTPEEELEAKRLDDEWFDKVQSNRNLDKDSSKSAPSEWNALREFHKLMEKKYLPRTLECHIHTINVGDLERVKRGIISALWNCDCSHYKCSKTDDIKIETDEEYYFTKVTLTASMED